MNRFYCVFMWYYLLLCILMRTFLAPMLSFCIAMTDIALKHGLYLYNKTVEIDISKKEKKKKWRKQLRRQFHTCLLYDYKYFFYLIG